jgi:hypothetical protein
MKFVPKMTKYLIIVAASFMMVSACKKYPDGPTVSFLPKKERIEGKWVANKVVYNSTDSTSVYKSHVWEFTRNYSVISQQGSVKRNGVWSTTTSDKDFVIDYDDGGRELYQIRKLTRKEFWIRNKQTQADFQLKAF